MKINDIFFDFAEVDHPSLKNGWLVQLRTRRPLPVRSFIRTSENRRPTDRAHEYTVRRTRKGDNAKKNTRIRYGVRVNDAMRLGRVCAVRT